MSNNPKISKQLVEQGDDHYTPATNADVMAPIVISLGKKKKKQIKRFKRGKGGMMNEVLDVVDQVQEQLGDAANGKIIVPVVIIYRKKERRFKGLF